MDVESRITWNLEQRFRQDVKEKASDDQRQLPAPSPDNECCRRERAEDYRDVTRIGIIRERAETDDQHDHDDAAQQRKKAPMLAEGAYPGQSEERQDDGEPDPMVGRDDDKTRMAGTQIDQDVGDQKKAACRPRPLEDIDGLGIVVELFDD